MPPDRSIGFPDRPHTSTAAFQKVPENRVGRDFVVGDVHGMLDSLKGEMARVSFDPTKDRLFSVGDLIDRGPKSMQTLMLLRQPWFYAVRGNHEQMMLDATSAPRFETWLINGGDWILDEPGDSWILAYSLVLSMPIALEIEGGEKGPVGLTHSGIPVDDWADLKEALGTSANQRFAMWSRDKLKSKDPVVIKGVHFTVHGHTPIERPEWHGNCFFIDTGCVYGGPLTLLNLADIAQQ